MSGLSAPLLDLLYGQLMRVRRRRAERHPERRRRLDRPVVSVGNLSLGGTGKSPVVAAIASWLVARGERPSILSRGYARRRAREGVVVVSDGSRILAPVDDAGDEPLMLARQVPGAIVCVSPDRYLAGVLAERALGCTVHVLDDGFQHVGLGRDLDILVTTVGEIPNGHVVPRGRLREPIDAASHAHVLVVSDATAGAAASEAWTLGISQACAAERVVGEPIPVSGVGSREPGVGRGSRVVAVAGIANPERFGEALGAAGWHVAEAVTLPDHHWYSRGDLARVADALARTGAKTVLTTDKDAVRLEPLGALPFPVYRVPLSVRFDPEDAVFGSLAAALDRAAGAGAAR
jgi:tetraacyldisaccharide 4'-kinase